MSELTVLRGGALGDFILTLPAINSARRAYPDFDLHIIGCPSYAKLAQPHRISDHGDRALSALFSPENSAIPEETAQLFSRSDVVVAYLPDGKYIAERMAQLIPGTLIWTDPRPHPRGRIHMCDHLLEPLRAAGLNPEISIPDITVPSISPPRSNNPIPRRFVAIHPGSGSRDKCWPLERFLNLADMLARTDRHILFLTGAVERERFGMDDLGLNRTVLEPQTPSDLARLVAGAELFIGNDSGPGHLAAAVGTRTLSIFGPTDPDLWRPRGRSRCETIRAPQGELEKLATEAVFEAATAMLLQSSSGSSS